MRGRPRTGSTPGSPRAPARTRYRIHEAVLPDPFTARFVWHRPGHLPLGPMREAARSLVGEHDFASFCRRPGGDARPSVIFGSSRWLGTGTASRSDAEANAFLHQMVRTLVGTLVAVGEGAHRSRRDAGHPRRS